MYNPRFTGNVNKQSGVNNSVSNAGAQANTHKPQQASTSGPNDQGSNQDRPKGLHV